MKVVLFNPRSAEKNHRIPLSVLQIAASITGKFEYTIVDGNLERDPFQKISKYLSGNFIILAISVMPGPQVRQAFEVCRSVKKLFPSTIIIWGGYFASNHTQACISSGLVDLIVTGPGDVAFPALLDHIDSFGNYDQCRIPGVIYKNDGEVIQNPPGDIPDFEKLQPLPYDQLENFYPIEKYIARTFIGKRTFLYHSGTGCPYRCSFCGVAAVYHGKWKMKSSQEMFSAIMDLKEKFSIDAVEIIDSNFFISKERVLQFCRLMKDKGIRWWAEGRIDAIDKYSNVELKELAAAGCSLIFMGAETGNDELLKNSGKGGTITREMTLRTTARLAGDGIIPQLSFVLGLPGKDSLAVDSQVKSDLEFMRELKHVSALTQLIIYIFSPVPLYGTDLSAEVYANGFTFPATLEEWASPEWERFELRKGRITPWLLPQTVTRIRDFETVVNAAFPGISNFHIPGFGKKLLQRAGRMRYDRHIYSFPYEIKLLQKLLRYTYPEKEGFYSE